MNNSSTECDVWRDSKSVPERNRRVTRMMVDGVLGRLLRLIIETTESATILGLDAPKRLATSTASERLNLPRYTVLILRAFAVIFLRSSSI